MRTSDSKRERLVSAILLAINRLKDGEYNLRTMEFNRIAQRYGLPPLCEERERAARIEFLELLLQGIGDCDDLEETFLDNLYYGFADYQKQLDSEFLHRFGGS